MDYLGMKILIEQRYKQYQAWLKLPRNDYKNSDLVYDTIHTVFTIILMLIVAFK